MRKKETTRCDVSSDRKILQKILRNLRFLAEILNRFARFNRKVLHLGEYYEARDEKMLAYFIASNRKVLQKIFRSKSMILIKILNRFACFNRKVLQLGEYYEVKDKKILAYFIASNIVQKIFRSKSKIFACFNAKILCLEMKISRRKK